MTVQEQIKSELRKIRDKYLASADEINSDYNRENAVSDDYKGRQIFELLQNAEDESEEGKGKVLIEYTDNIFTISNTGNLFSFKGVKSLLRANNSPKKLRENTIGNKGLGFRSTLNWAKKISVITQDFALEFSKENARNYLISLFDEKPQLREELKGLTSDEYPIAVLACPKLIIKTPKSGYITTIQIECNDNCKDDVSTQIENLDLNELLFLKGLQEVTVITNNSNRTFSKKSEEGLFTIIEYDNLNKVEISCSKWQLFTKKGSIKYDDDKEQKEVTKNYELIIAYDSINKTSSNYLYSYFKTKTPISFPGIIHGTFDLTTDRNYLKPENIINKQLIEILADFIIETAIKISEQNKKCNYEPLKLILTQEKSDALADYGFYEILKNKVKDKRIFPSINNKYLSLKDNPKYSNKRYDEFLNSATFFDLLQHCDDNNIENFLQINLEFYNNNDFAERINNDVLKNIYSIDEKCALMKLLRSEYSFSKDDFNLLVDINGEIVTNKEKVYIKPLNDQIVQLPKCVKSIRFLNSKMQEILLENGTQQTLSDNYKDFGILPYRFNTLITNIIKSLNENLLEENVLQVLVWLFNYYKSNQEEEDISSEKIQEFNIPVICRNEIKKATESYFGKEYSNEIGENIISVYSKNFLKDNSSDFKFADKQEVISFYEWLGVSKYPRIKNLDIPREKHSDYLDYCFDFIESINCRGDEFYRKDFSYWSVRKLNLDVIEHYDSIFSEASFDDILCWMLVDNSIHERLKSRFEINSMSKMDCTPGRKIDIRPISNQQLASYIRFLLVNEKWIKVKDGKCSPKYCCMESLGLEPKIYVPEINYEYIRKTCGASKLQVNLLLQEVGVAYQFLDLSIDIQYEILMTLPEIDFSKKTSRKIYNLVKMLDPNEVSGSIAYKKFLREGKVLAKYKENKEFVNINEAYYVDKKVFSEDLLKEFKIFDIEHRVGNEKVRKLFGVKPLNNLEVEFIKCTPINQNLETQFSNDYKDFISYVLVSRKQTKNYRADLGRLRRTSVKLVLDLSFKSLLTDSEEKHNLKDFETIYFRKTNTAFVKIPATESSLFALKQNINFTDTIAELITTILDVNEDKNLYRELFGGNRTKRDFLIRNDKGDENLEILNTVRKELNVENNEKLDFWTTLAGIKKIDISENFLENSIIQDLGIPFEIANSIDYEDINSFSNVEYLRQVFNKLGIQLNEYNDMSLNSINLIPFWTSQFNQRRSLAESKYKTFAYSICKDKKNMNEFNRLISNFNNLEPQIPNILNFDVEQKSKELFEISFSDLDLLKEIDFSKIIQSNRNKYQNNEIEKKNEYFGINKVNLYLLFDSFDSLTIPEEKFQQEPYVKTQKDINQLAENMTKNIDIEDSDIERTKETESSKENKNPKIGGGIHTRKEDISKQTTGLAGEIAVYKKLIKKYPNLQWLSGNAENYKHIEKGDDTLGYDMSYINDKGQKVYIEVKASTSNRIEFKISKNEIDFALRHPKDYEIYFVFLENSNAHIKRLGTIFDFKGGEDLFNNTQFSIQNENYIIAAAILE